MTRLVNLTPHTVVLRDAQGVDHNLPSEGVARVAVTRADPEVIPGVPVPVLGRSMAGLVWGLPEPEEGTMLIVSAMVLAACPDRADLVAPGTGPMDGAIRSVGVLPPAVAAHLEAVESLLRELLADAQLQELPLRAWPQAREILEALPAVRTAATPAGGQIVAVTRLVR